MFITTFSDVTLYRDYLILWGGESEIKPPAQIATLRWADVGLRAFGSLARRRNPTLAHRNVAHWRHVGPTFGLQPYANPIPPLSNVGPTSVKTIYNHVPT